MRVRANPRGMAIAMSSVTPYCGAFPGGYVRVLVLLTLMVSAADHWTTYVCLRAPVEGWRVSEANPLAEWLFQAIGLVPGLVLDSAITVLALAFLLATRLLPVTLKSAFLSLVLVWTGVAVLNNWQAIQTMGLSATGGS